MGRVGKGGGGSEKVGEGLFGVNKGGLRWEGFSLGWTWVVWGASQLGVVFYSQCNGSGNLTQITKCPEKNCFKLSEGQHQ